MFQVTVEMRVTGGSLDVVRVLNGVFKGGGRKGGASNQQVAEACGSQSIRMLCNPKHLGQCRILSC